MRVPTAYPAALHADGLSSHGRAGHRSTVWRDDDASQSFLHISPQSRVLCKLRLFGTASGSLGVPLRCGRAIFQPATSGGGVAPQLPGDRRCRPPESASDLLHRVALHAKERDLLSLCKREIPAGERPRRESKHCWGHAACFPEPSCSYRLRHPGLDCGILTGHACRDRRPEPSSLISACHRRSTW